MISSSGLITGMLLPLEYPSSDGTSNVGGTLEPLTAAVVEITIRTDRGEVGPITIQAGPVEGLQYKVYLENEEPADDGGPGCVSVAENQPRTVEAPSPSPIHVLVANTQHAPLAVLTYSVSVAPATGN